MSSKKIRTDLTHYWISAILIYMRYTTAQICGLLKIKRGTLHNLMARAGVRPESGQVQKEVLAGPVRNFFSPENLRVLRSQLALPRLPAGRPRKNPSGKS